MGAATKEDVSYDVILSSLVRLLSLFKGPADDSGCSERRKDNDWRVGGLRDVSTIYVLTS